MPICSKGCKRNPGKGKKLPQIERWFWPLADGSDWFAACKKCDAPAYIKTALKEGDSDNYRLQRVFRAEEEALKEMERKKASAASRESPEDDGEIYGEADDEKGLSNEGLNGELDVENSQLREQDNESDNDSSNWLSQTKPVFKSSLTDLTHAVETWHCADETSDTIPLDSRKNKFRILLQKLPETATATRLFKIPFENPSSEHDFETPDHETVFDMYIFQFSVTYQLADKKALPEARWKVLTRRDGMEYDAIVHALPIIGKDTPVEPGKSIDAPERFNYTIYLDSSLGWIRGSVTGNFTVWDKPLPAENLQSGLL
ncbi:hypothetical protein BT63DRAFT_474796 [Microthyrium microscopicum]|uniref:Uncharacterized protein n=1 Tax=Microthyrium microscopicum TaxID=703497 RepID=A0A6A6USB8_9PEZI|nr:hypothetical protein BT63DRAFT_474796 [Microthyrium microscopicum]